MKDAADFDVSDVRLPQLAVRVWQGLVFAAVDEAGAPPFEDFVAGIDAAVCLLQSHHQRNADRGLRKEHRDANNDCAIRSAERRQRRNIFATLSKYSLSYLFSVN
mgnify:CR=1 FL=1